MTDIPSSGSTPAVAAGPPHDLLTVTMLDALRATKPWVRFLSIVGFVMVGLITVIALGTGAFGIYQMTQGNNEGAVLAAMSLFYLLLAILYIFPSRFLFRYASAIGEALDARSKSAAVERALRHQKSFWKFAGIMTLVSLLLYIPAVVAAIAIPNLLTATQRSKQKRSMADIRAIATAIETYGVEHNRYPEVANIDELAPLLEPKYIQRLPRVDGWGHAFVYRARCDNGSCSSYTVASPGKDGTLEQPLSDYDDQFTATTTFDDDIVFRDGSFVRAPEGSGR